MNDKRFTFRWLGVFMETVNHNPKETRKTIWTMALSVAFVVAVWRLLDIATVVLK